MEWIQHVNLEKELVADAVTIERNALDKSDVSDEGGVSLVLVAAIANRKGTVDGYIELTDVGGNYRPIRTILRQTGVDSPSSGIRLPSYPMYRYGNAP